MWEMVRNINNSVLYQAIITLRTISIELSINQKEKGWDV